MSTEPPAATPASVPPVSAPVSLPPENAVSIYKGRTNTALVGGLQPVDSLSAARKDVADAMNSKHLSFLFGSGCSSARGDQGQELGIPTMAPMAKLFLADLVGFGVSDADRGVLLDVLGIELTSAKFASNLEALMEVLYGFAFTLRNTDSTYLSEALPAVERTIAAVKSFVLQTCLNGQNTDATGTVLSTYERFYRRLAQRDRALPRPWVFTTNYDLFSETAMDRLGMPYINGFQGSMEEL